MSTVRTCTTPKDGWALYGHFLGNLLQLISMQGELVKGEEERQRVIDNAWAQLAGNLYMIMRRMKLNGHDDTAAKMQQIVDMVVGYDLTDPKVREAIHAKHRELDPGVGEFEEAMKQARAEHAPGRT